MTEELTSHQEKELTAWEDSQRAHDRTMTAEANLESAWVALTTARTRAFQACERHAKAIVQGGEFCAEARNEERNFEATGYYLIRAFLKWQERYKELVEADNEYFASQRMLALHQNDLNNEVKRQEG